MKKLNLKNSALITLIIALINDYIVNDIGFLNYSSFEVMLSVFIGHYGANFFMGWIIPVIPYALHSLIKIAFASKKESDLGFKLFKLLWYVINFLLLLIIIMELTNPLPK